MNKQTWLHIFKTKHDGVFLWTNKKGRIRTKHDCALLGTKKKGVCFRTKHDFVFLWTKKKEFIYKKTWLRIFFFSTKHDCVYYEHKRKRIFFNQSWCRIFKNKKMAYFFKQGGVRTSTKRSIVFKQNFIAFV